MTIASLPRLGDRAVGGRGFTKSPSWLLLNKANSPLWTATVRSTWPRWRGALEALALRAHVAASALFALGHSRQVLLVPALSFSGRRLRAHAMPIVGEATNGAS